MTNEEKEEKKSLQADGPTKGSTIGPCRPKNKFKVKLVAFSSSFLRQTFSEQSTPSQLHSGSRILKRANWLRFR